MRRDGQTSGLSAEFFVAAELLKREIQTSVTFGAAKAIDLLAYNSKTRKHFAIQVKALRNPNYFLISPAFVKAEYVYAFVLLGVPGKAVRYFIVPGKELLERPEDFDKYFNKSEKMSGISSSSKKLATFENRWDVFLA